MEESVSLSRLGSRSPIFERKRPSISTPIRMSSRRPTLTSMGSSAPTASEKRNTAFSIIRNPTRCEKIRWRVVMSSRPASSPKSDTPRKSVLVCESLTQWVSERLATSATTDSRIDTKADIDLRRTRLIFVFRMIRNSR